MLGMRLGLRLTSVPKARKSAEAGLKNVQDQAEEQHKKLYLTKIKLATQKQLVLDLKAKLEKAKAVVQMTKEAVEVSRQASYNLRVEETEIWLAEELAEVCWDYCKETWMKALNLTGVPAASEWRQARSVYYPPDIREFLTALPSPSTLAPESSEQPLTAQAILPPSEVAKDKGKGKEVKPPSKAKYAAKAKDATEAKDAAVKAKEAEAKTREADFTTKDAPASQLSKKDDSPPSAKA